MDTGRHIPEEMIFIIDCIRRFVLTRDHDQSGYSYHEEVPAKNLNWDRLIEHIHRHRLTALVHEMSRYNGIEYPSSFIERLKHQRRKTAVKSLKQMAELRQLTEIFQERGIDFIVLKGLPLAQELYGDIVTRTSHDIDVLVKAEDAREAFSCMFTLGYESHIDRDTLRQQNLMARLRLYANKDVVFFSKKTHHIVEVHWRLAGSYASFPVPTVQLLKDKRTVNMAGTDIPVMGKENMALFLCYHGSVHHWCRLHWLCDMALLLFRRNDLDWPRIAAEAKRLGTEPTLAMAQALVNGVLKIPVPKALSNDPVLYHTGLKYMNKVLPDIFENEVGEMEVNIRSLVWLLRLQTGYRNRMKILLKHLCPSDLDRDFIRLPDCLAWLYFLIRPLRLAYKAGTRLSR